MALSGAESSIARIMVCIFVAKFLERRAYAGRQLGRSARFERVECGVELDSASRQVGWI